MAEEKAIKSFSKGMNSDLGVNIPQPETYIFGENVRVVTDSGLSSFALANVRGTEFKVQIPSTSSVVSLEYTSTLVAPATNITISTVTTGALTDTFTSTATTIEGLYVELAAFINASATYAGNFIAVSGTDWVIIYSSTLLETITATFTAANWIITERVPAIATPLLIGSGGIRDKIILFTTDCQLPNPGGVDSALPSDPASSGQIWVVTVNEVTGAYTIQLAYNNILNFTTYHAIPNTGGSVGRYEIEGIQRIYWTDWFNRPRRFNIADPDGFALRVEKLQTTANITLNVPILQEVLQTGGQLNVGVHQVAYRLKKLTGSETVWSMPSNLVYVTIPSENGSERDYIGSDAGGTASAKRLKFRISGMDTSYDRVEILHIFRDAINATPRINILLDEPISGSTKDFIIAGSETAIPVTLDEFIAEPSVLKKVKSITSKNNFLLPANIVYENFNLDFDARAYRFDYNGNSVVNDGAGNPTSVNTADPVHYGIPSVHDSINPNQGPDSRDNYIFKSDGSTYGGEGPLVSYTFTDVISSDTLLLDTHDLTAVDTGNGVGPPYFNTSPDSITVDLNTTYEQYPHVNAYRDYHSPYIVSAAKQYMRDEVYRFGIVFISKAGQKSFVHWIGDIRMPHVFMPDPATGNRVASYIHTTGAGNPDSSSAHPLGVVFKVDISTIADQIQGFSIVRVKREEDDKTVKAQGAFYPAFQYYFPNFGTPAGSYALPDQLDWVTEDFTAVVNGSGKVSATFASFNSPDYLFKNNYTYRTGDYLDIVGLMQFNSIHTLQTGNTFTIFSNYHKVQKTNNITTQVPANITANDLAISLDAGVAANNADGGLFTHDYGPELNSGGASFYNRSYHQSYTAGGGFDILPSVGGATVLLRGSFGNFAPGHGSGYTDTDDVVGDFVFNLSYSAPSHAYLANYKRLVSNQYGGNTYSARSNNVYMSTGHYQPLQANTSSYTNKVYGGDTYIAMFDNVKQFVHPLVSSNKCVYTGRVFPVETAININLRKGYDRSSGTMEGIEGVFNKEFYIDSPNSVIGREELFELRSVYDAENDLYEFVPQPVPFIENNEFDTRILGSEAKINGELIDSWTIFKPNVFLDVEGIYGPINNVLVLRDQLYYYQDKAFGIASINTRSLVQDSTGDELQLGTAGLLSRFDYLNTESGCKHQFGMSLGNQSIYYYDAIRGEMCRFTPGQQVVYLGFAKGLSGYLSENLEGTGTVNDTPIQPIPAGMLCTFDYDNYEALFAFKTTDSNGNYKTFTLSYNELIEAWNGFYSYNPWLYVNNTLHLLSTKGGNLLGEHGLGDYGSFYAVEGDPISESRVTFVTNDDPKTDKKFDNYSWVSEYQEPGVPNNTFNASTWSFVRNYNDYQNSGWTTIVPKPGVGYNASRTRKREWTMDVQRNAVISALLDVDVLDPINLDQTQILKPRMSGTYMITDLRLDNSLAKRFVCPLFETSIRRKF